MTRQCGHKGRNPSGVLSLHRHPLSTWSHSGHSRKGDINPPKAVPHPTSGTTATASKKHSLSVPLP